MATKSKANNPTSVKSTKREFFKLRDNQKQGLALILSLLVLTTIIGGFNWYTNPSFRQSIWGQNPEPTQPTNPDEDRVIRDLQKPISQLNPEQILYQQITLSELPVYPQAWVERYFNQSERLNALISGPGSDPDRDGLGNKEEFLYGSNPRNSDTLCEQKIQPPRCTGKNDKQNVEAGISPLTGLSLEPTRVFRISRQDLAVLDKIKNSFENAAKEGVDFPSLYQLSKTIDLSQDYNKIQINTKEDNRQTILDYNKLRLQIIQDFSSEDELASLSEIYQLTTPEDVQKLKSKYQKQYDLLQQNNPPERFKESHRAYVFLFQQLIELIDSRAQALKQNTVINEEFKKQNKEKATRVTWAFRKLNEELSKIPIN